MYHRNPSINLSHHLWLRESNLYPGIRHPVPSHFLYHERNFYRSITPRLTVQNVDKPYGYLRKFTPDGRKLLAFSYDQKSIDVYDYKGVSSVAYMLKYEENEFIDSEDREVLSQHIRRRLFDILLKREFHIPLVTTSTTTRHILNREFSLFLDNGRYVLLGSAAAGSIFPDFLAYHHYSDLYDDTELYDYTFYLVDLRKGFIADTLKMEHDFIFLSHNNSISLYDRTLAILSTYRQCIEIIEVNVTEGKFHRLFTIGPYGNDLDRDRVLAHQQNTNYTLDPDQSLPLSHLKQKILACMYRNIMNLNYSQGREEKLKDFYKKFGEVENMIITKMQLIDSDHILLRYENRPSLSDLDVPKILLVDKSFKTYVFYNISEQKVLRIFPQESMELAHIVRNHIAEFCNVHSLHLPWHASSSSNNYLFQSSFDQAFVAYAGDLAAAAARFNSSLPITSQSFATSPYLDYSLFKYEDRYISTLERPRLHNFVPIEFYDRKTGQILYRAHLDEPCDSGHADYEVLPSRRELVSFIFHPYEPFFISIQKSAQRYIVNFHMYNSFSKVEI